MADGDHLQFGDSRYRIHISGTAGPPVSLVRAALHNPATDRWEHLVKPITIVGRRGQSDLHLSGDQISRAHALLVRCGDGLVVHDLGSRSGTFAGGQRRHEALLTGGQTLAFGPFQFQVEVSPEEQSPQAAETGPGEPEDFLAQVLGESEGPTEKPADDFLADLLAPPQEQPPTADGPAEAPPAADADQETRPAKTRQVSAPPGPQGEPKDHPQDDFEDAIAEALAAAAAGGGPAEEPFEDLSAIEPAPLTPPESKDETEEQDPAPEKHADDSADTAGNGTRKHG
ncbi:MAG: FHA domain-containing protein [Anaerolineaceae bacterium]|nr:FHA domain-containing protein [Anaerolineaceae bacterium]